MMDWELTSRLLVIALYTAALVVAVYAYRHSILTARRRSAITIGVIAAAWIVFYTWLLTTNIHAESNAGLISRVGHYVTASGLVFMASQIWGSDQAVRRVLDELDA